MQGAIDALRSGEHVGPVYSLGTAPITPETTFVLSVANACQREIWGGRETWERWGIYDRFAQELSLAGGDIAQKYVEEVRARVKS